MRGLGVGDLLVNSVEIVVALIPFFLARRWLATPERHQALLIAIMALGVVYAFLALFEIRMSPQLNRWVYGFFPHQWTQHIRGGFRPLVFLEHGLWLGFFLFTAAVASFALIRTLTQERRMAAILSALLILGTLLISRNLGAVLLAALFLPVVSHDEPRPVCRS